jgi:hypothetical protein
MMTTTSLKKLKSTAEKLLRDNNNEINRAAPKLALVLMDNAMRPQQIAICAYFMEQLPTMSPSAEEAKPPAKEAEPTAKRAGAMKPVSRRRVGNHRRVAVVSTPGTAGKAGALAARREMVAEIFLRRIRGVGALGAISVHELRSIAESQAMTSAEFVLRGYDDAVESIALTIISNYCVAADPFALVVDVIPPAVAVKAFEVAKVKAIEVFRDGTARIAKDLIASARDAELPPTIDGSAT